MKSSTSHKDAATKGEDIMKFDPSLFKHEFLEISTFSVLFAKHRLNYLKSIEKYAKKACENKKLLYKADYIECTLEVQTTKETRDPYAIVKGNDFIQLLSRGVPLEEAMKVLDDNIFSDIILTREICKNEKTFERRRNRLANPKILRAIELITKCKVFISGKTVSLVGDYRGINDAKKIVVGCFENIHPVYSIKKLMIKKDLAKKDVEGDWDRYLPQIKKTHTKQRKPGRTTGGMPEEIKPRKEDIERETGEFYLDEKNLASENRGRRAKREGAKETGKPQGR